MGHLLGTLPSVDLRNIATAFVILEIEDFFLFNKIAEMVFSKKDEEEFSAVDISSIAEAFAVSRIDSEILFKSVSAIVAKIQKFSSRDVALIVRSFASMRIYDETVVSKMELCVFADIASFNAKQIADLIWSFAQFGRVNMLDALFHQLEMRIEEDEEIDFVNFVEVYQVFLHFKEHIRPLTSFVGLNKEIEKDLNQQRTNPPKPSALHEDIIKELKRAGIPHRVQMFARGYFIPIFFSFKIGIEIFEPQNYLASGKESGEWMFRKEVLKKSGYDLNDISFKNWEQLIKEQKAVLIFRLKHALTKRLSTK